jgi:hypothetical protein
LNYWKLSVYLRFCIPYQNDRLIAAQQYPSPAELLQDPAPLNQQGYSMKFPKETEMKAEN